MMQGYLGSAIASLRALYVKEDCSQDLSDFATVCREFATVCRDVTELSRNCFNCRCCCCYTNVNNANNWCLYFTRKYLFSLFNWTQLKHLITSDLWIWLPVFSSSASKLVLFAMSQAANRERESKPWNRDESFQYSTQIQPQPKTNFLNIYLKNRLPSYSYLNKLDS